MLEISKNINWKELETILKKETSKIGIFDFKYSYINKAYDWLKEKFGNKFVEWGSCIVYPLSNKEERRKWVGICKFYPKYKDKYFDVIFFGYWENYPNTDDLLSSPMSPWKKYAGILVRELTDLTYKVDFVEMEKQEAVGHVILL